MRITRLTIFCLAFMLSVVISLNASATDNSASADSEYKYHPSAENMIFDGLVYRPLSLAGTLLGAGFFLVTLPFSLIGGNADEAGQVLVLDPADSTFNRCLGCLPDNTTVHYRPGD